MTNIVEIARSYIGQKEKPGNSGFVDPEFENEMRSVGWYKFAPWCMFLAKLIWKRLGFDHSIINGSAVSSAENAAENEQWSVIPQVGSIAIWRLYKNGKPVVRINKKTGAKSRPGHGAVVVSITPYIQDKNGVPVSGSFNTMDGNTSINGSREGNASDEKTHSFSWYRKDGLRLMGFISPK